MIPVLLIVIPLLSGLIAFAVKQEKSVKAWALLSSLVTLAISVAGILTTKQDWLAFNKPWLPSIGSSFNVGLDGMGKLLRRHADGRAERYELELPQSLARYVAAKGSVTIDGVSLTVNEVQDKRFSVCLIPHTLQVTTLGELQPGQRVNIEVDLVARYLERLLAGDASAGYKIEGSE